MVLSAKDKEKIKKNYTWWFEDIIAVVSFTTRAMDNIPTYINETKRELQILPLWRFLKRPVLWFIRASDDNCSEGCWFNLAKADLLRRAWKKIKSEMQAQIKFFEVVSKKLSNDIAKTFKKLKNLRERIWV